jgi:hypothetical protein
MLMMIGEAEKVGDVGDQRQQQKQLMLVDERW